MAQGLMDRPASGSDLTQPGAATRIHGDQSAAIKALISSKRPKNVILMIGDGMGYAEITGARNYALGAGGFFKGLDALPFTGVCYSLNTFLALQEKPQCRAVLCGGEFHASNAIFMPLSLEDTLSHLSPDIAFYSAAGIDCEQGATCYNLEELPVKHWAMRHARYHVLVVDHSKFGKVRPARMGALAKFDVIASDICPDDELVALAKAQQISLLY